MNSRESDGDEIDRSDQLIKAVPSRLFCAAKSSLQLASG